MPSLLLAYGYVIVCGLVVGSFLNVVIYRLPREKSVIGGRSLCPHCGTRIPFYHNIPVISWLLLRARCHSCGGRISLRYPLVETINAAFYVLFFYLDGPGWYFIVHCYLSSVLLAIFFIDFDFQIIPDKITIPGIFIGVLSSFFLNPPGIVNSLLGVLVGGGSLLGIAYLGQWMFKKEAMGGGDIKMAAMMGAFLGWKKIFIMFFGGAFLGLIVSLIWMTLSPGLRKERLIPFGPFLALAAMVALLYGDQLIHLYITAVLR
jgi:leader peptidase (prepilin peptidase)/N-methyltransferase